MNIKDRGNKKWTSLMLVEHKNRLRRLKESENNRQKPELDQQRKEEIEFKLKEAQKRDKLLEITFFEDRSFKKLQGRLQKIEQQKQIIELKIEASGEEKRNRYQKNTCQNTDQNNNINNNTYNKINDNSEDQPRKRIAADDIIDVQFIKSLL